MCRCRSYNLNVGLWPEVVLRSPWPDRSTICVDACMANTIALMWSGGIYTLSSCCGHGIMHRFVVVDRADRVRAELFLESIGDPAVVYAWELVSSAGDKLS